MKNHFKLSISFPQANNDDTVLGLNSYDGWKPAMLINSAGEQKKLRCFERDYGTDANHACSINWRNRFYVFGGQDVSRQISRLNGYTLERVGSLPFDHNLGSCSVMSNQFIFLCFGGSDDYKRCRRSTDPLEIFHEIALSYFDHRGIQTSCSDSESYFSAGHQLIYFFSYHGCVRILLASQHKGRNI